MTEPAIVSTEIEKTTNIFQGITTPCSEEVSDAMQESARVYQQQVNFLNVASSNATYYDAQLVSSSDDPNFQDNLISINS